MGQARAQDSRGRHDECMSAIIRYRCTARCQASHRHVHEWTTATTDDVSKDSGAEYEWMTASDSTAAPSPREPKHTKCTGLVSWLLEQIAEDERRARAALDDRVEIDRLSRQPIRTVKDDGVWATGKHAMDECN